MAEPFRHVRVVQADEIDVLGHAGNLCYLRWILDAAEAHSDAVGWTAQRYLELGAAWVVRSHELTYVRPAMEGDELWVHTWVASARAASSVRRYRITRPADDAEVLRAATQWAFIDLATGAPRRIAAEVRSAYPILGDAPVGR